MSAIWIAILTIGLATYACRLAPLLRRPHETDLTQPPAWLARLGPCLLAAMATTVILPAFVASNHAVERLGALGGLISVGVLMRARRDPGLATLGGTTVYFLLEARWTLYQ
jgi:branched-subunit amino acid transport protein AzlD